MSYVPCSVALQISRWYVQHSGTSGMGWWHGLVFHVAGSEHGCVVLVFRCELLSSSHVGQGWVPAARQR